ncbi:hypothetical protein BC938DRAFT_480563, partial [Jimgerdemannia flammicorona]
DISVRAEKRSYTFITCTGYRRARPISNSLRSRGFEVTKSRWRGDRHTFSPTMDSQLSYVHMHDSRLVDLVDDEWLTDKFPEHGIPSILLFSKAWQIT